MSVLRKGVLGIAEIAVTLGLVGLLVCVHQLWWTNFEAKAEAKQEIETLRDSWAADPPKPVPETVDEIPEPGPESTDTPPYLAEDNSPVDVGLDGQKDGTKVRGSGGAIRGKAFAAIYIPRLGSNYVKPIVEGT